ncbi:cysteine--tRNA ligase [Columbia Basin potato purple top phytoplasma]|uniref:Cysteine--tRNA ligase n=1 Tax=Columbia Basin potato purple top phytoplasma TaxID=307134 RepID=A0ABT5LA18_9MOLU|nr:cysteine--tRNA ligase [Columbia Basin potato purple top phytoplasma]MDC9032026.1 cysteine--tRNA ligase [Columbia Basin potato purple top phytoplasma]
MKIYNSLIDQKENFCFSKQKKINIYVCGPTVYDHLHIGNIRSLIFFDLVKKYLSNLGLEVCLVVNITDIDDKIIQKAIDLKTTEAQISQKYINYFFELLLKLEIKTIDKHPLVTNYISDIILYIQELMDKGYTYFTDEGIYFKSRLITQYGEMSNQDLIKLKKNARKQLDVQKENTEDFILWKKTNIGVKYSSPWFPGRPGWHTECVVIIRNIFKNTIDIHGGGIDLKFPHHTNEQAQFWATNKKKLSNFFMHIGYVGYKNNKMSKSLGNVVLAKDLLKRFTPNVIKMFFLSYHYLQPINYNQKIIEEIQLKYDKIIYTLNKNNFQFFLNKINNQEIDSFYIQKFHFLMSNDFNTPNVLTLIEELLKKINKTFDLNSLLILQNTLIFLFNNLSINIVLKEITEEKIKLYYLWLEIKEKKDFVQADNLRKILKKEMLI